MNQKGIALIIAMCLVLLMGFTAQLFTLIIVNSRHNAQKEWNETSALYIAKAGANEAIRRLQKGDTITGSTTGNLLDGTYNYKSVTDGTDNWIKSTGTTHGESQIVIIAYGSTSSSGGAGNYFTYAVFTDGEQEYNGGGGEDKTVAHGANIHSNNDPDYGDPDETYPKINNASHYMVETGYTAESSPDMGFPALNIRYDTTNPNYNYYKSNFEVNNDYWHIATVNGTSNGDSNNHYYHDFSDTKLPSAYQLANMSGSYDMPTSNGATLILSTSATPPTVSIGNGTGTLIIIGANATMSGGDTFTGLIFVEKNKSNKGGNLTMSGNPTVNGAIVCRALDAGSGKPRVNYSTSYFNDDDVKSEDKKAKVNVFSWQAEY